MENILEKNFPLSREFLASSSRVHNWQYSQYTSDLYCSSLILCENINAMRLMSFDPAIYL